MNDIKQCPLVDWYMFRQCDIRTCKNHTTETKHQCIEIDRVRPEGTKQFSDAELNVYKFKQRGISTRLVQIYRKNAIQDVKSILTLYKYIDWIRENCKPDGEFRHEDMLRLEKEYPLKIKRLGWSNWMWKYLLDDKAWARFVKNSDGECSTFNVHQLLGIKLGRYEALLQTMTRKETP